MTAQSRIETTEALTGIRVVDASDSVAGQFCGRLFADNGAETVLVEAPGGSAVRRMGPFVETGEHAGRSTLFAHLNTGKSSVLLEGSDASEQLAKMVAGAHVLIVDGKHPLVENRGVAVTCRITPFGLDGPLASWRGSEMIYQALSGVMYENGRVEGPPLYGVGHRGSYAAGVIGYIQSLAALLAPAAAPRLVDVSIAEVAASMSFNRITQFSYNGEIEGRDIRTIPRAIVRCADGWASIFIYDNRWRHACRGLGLDDLVDDRRFSSEASRLKNWPLFIRELEARLASRSVDDVVAAGQRERAVVARAMSPSELFSEPQLRARGYWEWTRPGQLPRLGPMFRMSETPQKPHETAPGTFGGAAARWSSPARSTPRQLPDAVDPDGPLAGIRVVDLTTAWSGPMATRLLAALGASVVKIEGPSRIDDWRGPVAGGHRARYPDGVPGDRPFDRCYQFNTQNHDKRSLVVDLKTEAGLALVRRLAVRADVLIANFSAGTLDRMGLGFQSMAALNEGLIVVEMPAYGSGGPLSEHVALGPSMELMAGMASSIGYGDGRPVTTGPAYLDPLGGFNSAAAVLTAIAAREITGRGQHVELAQREAAMHWIGEEIVWAAAHGSDRPPDGNRVEGVVPHDAFHAAGSDEWIAIAAPDEKAFAALAAVIGKPNLVGDPRFLTASSRAANQAELSAEIAAWTSGRDKHEAALLLQEAGVCAAPVQNARDLNGSAFLRHRGLVQRMTHALAGTHDYQGLPLHTTGYDLAIRRPAPTFGQHNGDILAELGCSDSEIAELESAGVTASRPR